MALTRIQYLERRLPIESFVWDSTGLVVTITGHKITNGFTVTAPNLHSSYNSVSGIVEVIGVNSFRIVADEVLGSFTEVIVRGFTNTGLTPSYSIRKGEGAETVVQSWVTGTGGCTFTVQFSMDGLHWIDSVNITHTTINNDTGGFTFTAGWAYMRLNITTLGANTILTVIVGD